MSTSEILNRLYEIADFDTDEGRELVEIVENLCGWLDYLARSDDN